MIPYLQQAGFVGVAHMGFAPVDNSLITALVERWRPETHTFHMPSGECTITLEDIAMLTGLPIDGSPVIGRGKPRRAKRMLRQLLGAVPVDNQRKGNRVKLSWLATISNPINQNDAPELLEQRTRAYLLRIIGRFLFADHSSNLAHIRFLPMLEDFTTCGTYSWGSAVLAYLYRELCKASTDHTYIEMAGPVVLLQFWAWHRFPKLAPGLSVVRSRYRADRDIYRPLGFRWTAVRDLTDTLTRVLTYYRKFFDTLKPHQIEWQPYTDEIVASLPAFCVQGRGISLAIVPLICLQIIEWVQPDRVLRQFGLDQPIPDPPMQDHVLHELTLKGKPKEDWSRYHAQYLEVWDMRAQRCVVVEPLTAPLGYGSKYMRWYRTYGKLWIDPKNARMAHVDNCLAQLREWSFDPDDNRSYTGQNLRDTTNSMYEAIHDVDNAGDDLYLAPLANDQPRPQFSKELREGRARHNRTRRASATTDKGQSSSSVASTSH